MLNCLPSPTCLGPEVPNSRTRSAQKVNSTYTNQQLCKQTQNND